MLEGIRRYDRGYRPDLTKDEIKVLKARFFEASTPKAIAFTLAYLASIYLSAGAIVLLFLRGAPLLVALPVTGVLLLVIVRQQRSLENVVHFGSHLNFTRVRTKNDRLVNILAAWPMLSDVRTYRQFHQEHHGHYGSHDDPCRARFERMGLRDVDLSTSWALTRAVLRWLPAYVREYYRDVGSQRRQLVLFIAWHAVATAVLAMLASPVAAMLTTGTWMAAMFVILPVVRSIAEVGEHDYDRGTTEFDTTFSNLGFWDHVLFHPAGDAWHVLHHLYPTIPWWRQRQAHRFLMTHDRGYQAALHRTSMIDPSVAPRPDEAGLQT